MPKQVREILDQVYESLKRFLVGPVFPQDEDKTRQAQYANRIAIAFIVAAVFFGVIYRRLIQHYTVIELLDLLVIALVSVSIIVLVRLRRGHVRSSSIMLIAIVWIASNTMAAQQYGAKDASFLVNFAIVLTAGLLLGTGASIIVTILSVLAGFLLAYLEDAGRIGAGAYPITFFAFDIMIVMGLNLVAIVSLINGLASALKKSRMSVEELASANAILNYTQGELQTRSSELIGANQELENRTRKLHGIAEVARTTTAIHSFDQILPAITTAISEHMGYYYVGLFLLDEEKQYAILRSANTPEGLRMINRGYRIAVGSINPVGYIAQSGKPRVTRHREGSTFLENVEFPETRSQIVLPLGSGDHILGVLDIQSREANAFNEDDLATLSILSDQITIALENALLYERSQTALREADLASRQGASQAWNEYGKTLQMKGYRYDGIKSEPLRNTKQPKREDDALLIPVQLRDQTIGSLKLKNSDPTRQWTEDEMLMVKATAERVALALESARLLEEAQKRARRESFLSEVTAKLGTSFQLDSILRDTVEELGQTLKNSTVTFQLVNPSASPAPEPPKSNGAAADRNIVE